MVWHGSWHEVSFSILITCGKILSSLIIFNINICHLTSENHGVSVLGN